MNQPSVLLAFQNYHTVGDLVSHALERKKRAKESAGKVFESFNPTSDNFEFLIKQSGLIDKGEYLSRFQSSRTFRINWNYSDCDTYKLYMITGAPRMLRTSEVLGQIGMARTYHASTRELIGLYLSHRIEFQSMLNHGFRIVALGADPFHLHGCATIVCKRGQYIIREVHLVGRPLFRSNDVFVVRHKSGREAPHK